MVKDIEARLRAGEDVPDCLAKTMIELRNDSDDELDHLNMALLASSFMIGGVETVCIEFQYARYEVLTERREKTASIIQWFSALIPAYPGVQKKAQEELDRVIGRDRLPTAEDEKNLPYCHVSISICQYFDMESNYCPGNNKRGRAGAQSVLAWYTTLFFRRLRI